MKSTANRFGNAGVAASADSESSHGRHIVTPAPRSTVRREIRAIYVATFLGAPQALNPHLMSGLRVLPPSLRLRRGTPERLARRRPRPPWSHVIIGRPRRAGSGTAGWSQS